MSQLSLYDPGSNIKQNPSSTILFYKVDYHFIRPGKRVDNAYMESFNGRLRDECLNKNWFMSLEHARRVIEEWRIEYNQERPHSSLENLTPNEFRLEQENRFAFSKP